MALCQLPVSSGRQLSLFEVSDAKDLLTGQIVSQVIVDTSNEIGGDGDVPHPAIGGARRMQVPDPSQQHRVMVRTVQICWLCAL